MPSKHCRAAATALALIALAVPASAQSDGKVLSSTRDTLSRWVATKQLISSEKEDWELGKEVLNQRINLVQGEIDSLKEKIGQTETGLSDAAGKRRDLQSENRSLTDATGMLAETVIRLETKMKELVTRLPEPLRQRVAPLTQRLPENPVTSELAMSQRYQNVLGILNEINKFNRDLTVASEVRELADGRRSEVQALYLGLGQAYWVTADGRHAGVGVPGPDGWEWTVANDLAPEISRTIKVLQNEEVPDYTTLPVTLR